MIKKILEFFLRLLGIKVPFNETKTGYYIAEIAGVARRGCGNRSQILYEKRIKWEDLCHSDTANALKINNIPEDEEIISNLEKTADFLNRLIMYFDKTLYFTSGFRSVELNDAKGWSKTSAHCYGCALDLKSKKYHAIKLFKKLDKFFKRNNIQFDQLILEKPFHIIKHRWQAERGWVHLGLFRRQLTADHQSYEYIQNNEKLYCNRKDEYSPFEKNDWRLKEPEYKL